MDVLTGNLRRGLACFALLGITFLAVGCAAPRNEAPPRAPGVDRGQARASTKEAAPGSSSFEQVGLASWYGRAFAGKPTASGERFDPDQMTAAHPTLAFGSKVRVTNLSNGQSVIVRVNDRGPFGGRRVIDISQAAAKEIGMHRSGTARVSLTLVADQN